MIALGTLSKFDQCVLNMALIHICDGNSHVGQTMRQQYNAWKQSTQETVVSPWIDIHKFTIFLPHPDQTYEDITLTEGLSRGYNVEVEPVKDRSELIYDIRSGGHFVVVLKQKQVNGAFEVAATGVFVRSLGVLSLDVVVDSTLGEYQSLVVKHPIIRDYPSDWEAQLRGFLRGEIRRESLPGIVGYVDRTVNSDYRAPDWSDVYWEASDFSYR